MVTKYQKEGLRQQQLALTPVRRGVALKPIGLLGKGKLTAPPNLIDGELKVGVGLVALVAKQVLLALLGAHLGQQPRKVLGVVAGTIEARNIEANRAQQLDVLGGQRGNVVVVVDKGLVPKVTRHGL